MSSTIPGHGKDCLVSNNQRKRSNELGSSYPSKSKKICLELKGDLENMDRQKHANFATMAPNGVRNIGGLGKKQGSEKKVLSIKNFKGQYFGFIFTRS